MSATGAMRMRKPASTAWLLLVAACLLGACTITKLREDNEATRQNIAVKESELEKATRQQAEIEAERKRLSDELASRDFTLAEMTSRLQELERRNDAAATATDAQRRKKAERQKALAEAKKKVKEAEGAPVPGESVEAKARRLKALREELRRTLELAAMA